MILHPAPQGVVGIADPALAQLTLQLVDHRGNRATPRPAPRADVLAAAVLADGGTEPDEGMAARAEARSGSGGTAAEARERGWRATVDRALAHGRYVAVLVSWQVSLAAAHAGTDHRVFLAAQASLRDALMADLQGDDRYRAALDGAGDAVNRAVLACCSRLAALLGRGVDGGARLGSFRRRTGRASLDLERVAARTYRVRPWPFTGPRLTVVAEGRLLPHLRTDERTVLPDTWKNAPTALLRWQLLPLGGAATARD